jgi:hypothetical protein
MSSAANRRAGGGGSRYSNNSSSSTNFQLFWDKKLKSRSRFNLLLLEYGELFLEDLSVFMFPISSGTSLETLSSNAFHISDSLKAQGRLKLSSRSLIFEPNEVRRPLIKFPYKSMITSLQEFFLRPNEKLQLSVPVSGFFTFECTSYFEMKENDKIGSFNLVESSHPTGGHTAFNQAVKNGPAHKVLFALVHSDLKGFLVKVEQFRHIFQVMVREGTGMGNQLLQPFVEAALVTSFDFNNLVDFHEKLLLDCPVAVKKIKPLISNPGNMTF